MRRSFSPEEIWSSASEFFKDVVEVFDAMGTPPEGQERPPIKVLGGKTVTVNAGSYDLSGVYGGVETRAFMFAGVDKLTIAGNVAFRNENEAFDSAWEGLILLSAGSVSLPKGTAEERASVSYGGDFIEVSSFDTLEVINVDLSAEGVVFVRSLDSLVINNASMRTSGNGGPDFVHLRAFEEISADNLLFSDNMQRILMEAMTINLMNVSFPSETKVKLRSLYGAVDGKYPTFGSQNKQYGRVNFIQNVRYGVHLLNSRPAFNQHGGNITIEGR